MIRKSCLQGWALLVVLWGVSSCATWTHLENPQMSGPDGHYQVMVPDCWIHAAFITDRILISKDGPLLNQIVIEQIPRAQGFPLTRVKLTGNHLVTEVAEYYLAEITERQGGSTIRHLGTEPAELNGRAGFKIHLEIINAQGVAYEELAYGMLDDQHFYGLLYKAPRLHYFQKELAAFEGVVDSFQIRK